MKWEVITTTKDTNGDFADRHQTTRRTRRQLGVSAYHGRHSSRAQHARQCQRSRARHHAVRWVRIRRWPRPRAPGAARSTRHATGLVRSPWQQQVLAKGWGYATIIPASIQADNGAGLTEGIIGLVNKGQPRKPRRLGRSARLGLGREPRARLFRDRQIGRRQTRRGSKATRATARPPSSRWRTIRASAIAYVSSSGEGGAKLHRRNWGELVENVAGPASITGWPATS